MNAIDLFSHAYDLPPFVRTRVLSVGIPRVIPIAAGLRIKVDDVDERRAQTSMPFTRRSRNHVGSIYLGAILVQAEVTMATLVVGLCRAPRFRVLVKKNEAEFHAKARGTVRALCEPVAEERAELAKIRALVDDRADAWLTVRVTEAEKSIATVRFLITVRQKSG
jgi:acyl-coenzyme A thioesterase PaaI-like protein